MNASTRSKTRSKFGSTVLLLAAVGTLCMAAVQAMMPFSRELTRSFDGPSDWSTPLLFTSSFAVAALLVGVALYALSGAGYIRRLPFLRTLLVIAGLGLTSRGLPLPGQIAGALGYGPEAGDVSWVIIVGSAGTLVIGVGYLLGLALSWRVLSTDGRVRRSLRSSAQAR